MIIESLNTYILVAQIQTFARNPVWHNHYDRSNAVLL